MINSYKKYVNEKLSDKLSGFNYDELKQQVINGKFNLLKYYNMMKDNKQSFLNDEELFQYFKNNNINPNSMLYTSIMYNSLYNVKIAIENGAKLDKISLQEIFNNDYLDILIYLENNGFDIINNIINNIRSAIIHNSINVIKYCIDKFKFNYDNDFINVAVSYNNFEIVKYLIKKGFNINLEVIGISIQKDEDNITMLLLQNYKGDINNVENEKEISLIIYLLVSKNKYDLVKYILKIGYIIKEKFVLKISNDKKMLELLQKYYNKQND